LLGWLGAGLALSWIARFACAGCSQFVAGSAAITVLNDLRIRVFAHVQALSVSYFDKTKAGRIIGRVDRDVDSMEALLVQGPPELLSAFLRCLVAGVLLWQIAPALFSAWPASFPCCLSASGPSSALPNPTGHAWRNSAVASRRIW